MNQHIREALEQLKRGLIDAAIDDELPLDVATWDLEELLQRGQAVIND